MVDLCVIGCGIGGLLVAHYALKRNPNIKIIVLNAESRVGGKISTAFVDGAAYDHAAIYIGSAYDKLYKIVKEYNIQLIPYNEEYIKSAYYYKAIQKYGKFSTDKALVKYGFLNFMYSSSKRFNYTKMTEMQKMSLQDLIDKYNLQPLEFLVNLFLTTFGYGSAKDVHCGLIFSYFRPDNSVRNLVGCGLPALSSVAGGFLSMLETIQRSLETRGVRFVHNFRVTCVRQDSNVIVFGDHGSTVLQAKQVAVTCSPLGILFPHFSVADRQLFNRVMYYRYGTTVFETDIAIGCNFETVRMQNVRGILKLYSDKNVYIAYCYNSSEGLPEYLKSKYGATIKHIHSEQFVNYHPHFSMDDVQSGVYDKLDAIHNQKIFFTGPIFSFELTEAIACNAELMVERFVRANARC